MITTEQLYPLYQEHPIITTDSRSCPQGSIFIALKGDTFDGNKFAAQTLAAGCAYAVVDAAEYATDPRILLVEDGLKCLQDLARYHRQQLKKIPVIGITGTNGKTTTKELTANVLMKKYKVLYTQGNLNNHIGVPMTLLKLTPEHDMAIIEMGANHPGEIKTLVNIANPDYGLITNVGKAHLAGFGSFEGVIHTKGELYDYLREHQGKVFINAKNEHLEGIARGLDKIAYQSEKIYGKALESNPYLKIQWNDPTGQYEVQTQLIGAYNLENAMAAVCVGNYFGVDTHDIQNALESYTPSNNRSQWKKTGHNTLIIDAYNANPTSMNAALDNFIPYRADNKAVILGGMRELGNYSNEEHLKILQRLTTSDICQIAVIGKEFSDIAKDIVCPNDSNILQKAKDILYFDTTEDCKAYLQKHPWKEATILLKGSRANSLEQLIEVL